MNTPDPGRIPPPRDRRLAIVSVIGILICIFMSFLELSRAMSNGTARNWLYAVEWPIFAVFILWIWTRLERRHAEEHRASEQHRASLDDLASREEPGRAHDVEDAP